MHAIYSTSIHLLGCLWHLCCCWLALAGCRLIFNNWLSEKQNESRFVASGDYSGGKYSSTRLTSTMKSWNLIREAMHNISSQSTAQIFLSHKWVFTQLLSHKWFSHCCPWPEDQMETKWKLRLIWDLESQTRGWSPILCILTYLSGDCGAAYVKTIALHQRCTYAAPVK